jgi:formate hydrogenlyase subunit 4
MRKQTSSDDRPFFLSFFLCPWSTIETIKCISECIFLWLMLLLLLLLLLFLISTTMGKSLWLLLHGEE